MTYYGSEDLARSFLTVRNNTIAVAGDIPEEHYGFRAAPGTRTVAQTLVHIAVMPRMTEQVHFLDRRTSFEGFDFFAFMGGLAAEEQIARSKAQIIEMLRVEGDRFAQMLEGATEDFLGQRIVYPQGMTPPSKSRFEMLLSVKEHEMHHRGQLMLVERTLGIAPHLTRAMQERIAATQAARS